MTTLTAPCNIAVLDDGRVTFNIYIASEDAELLRTAFDSKDIEEDDSLLNVASITECKPFHLQTVFISGILKLKDKQEEEPKARIADVVFLGQCGNCDAVVDISDKLPFEQKKKLVASFGVELQNNVLTCKHITTLACCPHCNP